MSESGPNKANNDQHNNLDTKLMPRADWDRLFALSAQEGDRSPDRQVELAQEQQWNSLVNEFDRDEWIWGS